MRPKRPDPSFANWINESHAFTQWRDLTQKGTLRLCGPAGSGKTFIASRLSTMLLRRSGVPAFVLSFVYNNDMTRTLENLCMSLSRQLLSHQPSLIGYLGDFCDSPVKLRAFTAEIFQTLLFSLLSCSFGTPITCIIDNIQDCEASLDDFISQLSGLATLFNGSLKILVTDSHDCEIFPQLCDDISLANEDWKRKTCKCIIPPMV